MRGIWSLGSPGLLGVVEGLVVVERGRSVPPSLGLRKRLTLIGALLVLMVDALGFLRLRLGVKFNSPPPRAEKV